MTLIAKRIYELTRISVPKGTMIVPLYDPETGKDGYALLQDLVNPEGSYPTWSPDNAPFSEGNRVTWSLKLWESLIDDNEDIPSEGASWTEVSPTSVDPVIVDTDLKCYEQHDWICTAFAEMPNGWTVTASGAGALTAFATFGIDATEHAMGVVQQSTGSTSGGFVSLYKGVAEISFGVGFNMRLRMRSAIETLSDGSNTYTVYLGFGDNSTGSGDMTDGAYFRYNHSVNGSKWEAVIAKAGSRTAVDTGVSAIISVFKIFEVRINSAGTEATFYIDGSLVATLSGANFPGVSDLTGLTSKIEKSVGSGNRNLYMDWYDFSYTRNSPR